MQQIDKQKRDDMDELVGEMETEGRLNGCEKLRSFGYFAELQNGPPHRFYTWCKSRDLSDVGLEFFPVSKSGALQVRVSRVELKAIEWRIVRSWRRAIDTAR